MNASDLQSALQGPQPPVLINVLPPECHDARHIAGSHNACVYEVAFTGNVQSLVPEKDRRIVVYGAGGDSLDAGTAVEKLKAAGYTDVEAFSGSLDDLEKAGLKLEGTGSFPASPTLDGLYHVNPDASVIRWTGRNLFNFHHGTVKLSGGTIELADGRLVSACFTVDLRTIVCDDIADAAMNAMLIRHLRDPDFFEIDQHPTAEFAVQSAEKIDPCTDGTPNYQIHGHATVRGVTQPLDFPALIASADAQSLTAQAQFEVDRTRFGSHYGSGRFFRFLGKHVVNDCFHLHLKIQAEPIKTTLR